MLETSSYIASIISAVVGLLGLVGLGMIVSKIVFKQQNNTHVIVNGNFIGDVTTKGTVDASNTSKTESKNHE